MISTRWPSFAYTKCYVRVTKAVPVLKTGYRISVYTSRFMPFDDGPCPFHWWWCFPVLKQTVTHPSGRPKINLTREAWSPHNVHRSAMQLWQSAFGIGYRVCASETLPFAIGSGALTNGSNTSIWCGRMDSLRLVDAGVSAKTTIFTRTARCSMGSCAVNVGQRCYIDFPPIVVRCQWWGN